VGNKFLSFLILFAISLASMAEEETASTETLKELDVVVGLEKIIKLDYVPNPVVKLANENLAAYQIVPSKKEVLITGLKAGETTLTLRDSAGDIRTRYLLKVTASDQSKVVMQLKELLGDIEGLEIGIKGDSVYVGGMIVVPSDIGRVVVILDKYPDVLRLVELSPQTQLIIARKMQEEIQKSGFKDVTVRVVNGSFWVEGVVTGEKDTLMINQLVNAYMPDQIQNLARRANAVGTNKARAPFEILVTFNPKKQQDPVAKMYKIAAQFVELTKGYDRLFSFTWTPLIGTDGGQITVGKSGSGGVTTSSAGTLSATISNLFPKLNSAKSAGHARIIQSGVVIVKDGATASINKTNSIPFTVGAGDSARAGTANAGFNLTVTPKSLQEEKIELVTDINVSSNSGDTPPQTLQNTLKTTLIVKSQESAVIGGVVINKTTTDFDKDGDPGKIEGGSALFSFIKSKKYSTNRSQFVIFVTPEIIESAATGVSDIEKKFRKRSR
jgi:pilus assembly protein CpaC